MTGVQNNLHVVLGASGGLGSALVYELSLQQLPIRAINFSGKIDTLPKGVQLWAADCTDFRQLETVCRGASVIYNCLNAKYEDLFSFFPEVTKNLIALSKTTGVKVVVADNMDMYGANSSMPLTEHTPMLATDKKGQLRIGMTNLYLDTMAERRKITIGRAANYYGPKKENSYLGKNLFRQVLKNETINLVGNPEALHSNIYVQDFARGLAILGQNDKANGEIFHLPSAPTLTTQDFVNLTKRLAHSQSKTVLMGKNMVSAMALVTPILKEMRQVWYQYDKPFFADFSKFEKYFGKTRITSHEQAISQTLEWFKQKYRL